MQTAITKVLCLFPAKAVYTGARLVGLLYSMVPSARRSALSTNIAVVRGLSPGDRAVRRDVRRAFKHAMLNYVDLFRLARPDASAFVDSIYVPDWRLYDAVAARGKGVILVSAHLGNYDTVVQKLARRGTRTLIPVEPVDPPELLHAMRRQRAALGTEIIPVGADTFKQLANHLRSGGTTVIVSDRDIQGTGYPVSLFGQSVSIPQAAILLAMRTGAPIIGAFGSRHKDNSISAHFTREILLDGPAPVDLVPGSRKPQSPRKKLEHGMRELAALLEEEIGRDPGQWVVQQPVFVRPAATSHSVRPEHLRPFHILPKTGLVFAILAGAWLMVGRRR